MKTTRGFFLIELIIYIALLSLLLFIFLRQAVTVSMQLTQKTHFLQQEVALCALQRRFNHDIHAAPSTKKSWSITETTGIGWHQQKKHIYWYMKKNTLMRKEAIFDALKQRWLTQQTVCALHNVEQFHLTYDWHTDDQDTYLKTITVTVRLKEHNDKTWVCALRNTKVLYA